jgi:peptide-methionine (S)-S-oxide reductase
MHTATFGAGCFWSVEEAFRRVDGVIETAVGYAGGTTHAPSYEQVCTGRTGHAEVVQLSFDPATVTYEDLLDVFWSVHDPTQKDRQGPDVGTQYRSVIFFHGPEQEAAARAALDALADSDRYASPIATVLEPAPDFHRAEEYHQQYIAKGGRAACARPE